MASTIRKETKKGVRYYIQLSPGENESRPRISLGRVTKKQADTACRNIEELIKCQNTGSVIPQEVQSWLGGLADGLRGRLDSLGIADPKKKSITLEQWVKQYIAKRTDVKRGTNLRYKDVERRLKVFFKGQYLDQITTEQAKNFRIYLKTTAGLAENTVRRMIGICRQFFYAAMDAKIIPSNPFFSKRKGQLPVELLTSDTKNYYLTPEMAQKVSGACPDAEWRLIFGLARWGGLRCPSEILRLKWQDIDFDSEHFTVHASKTEHHANSGVRTVPIFPELKPLFLDAYEQAKTGDIYCVSRHRKVTSFNMKFLSILHKGKIKPWPKLFQNLRSTRETELYEMTNGNIKAVCTWIGNSPEVALKHYIQLTDEKQKEAARLTLMNEAEKSVQNTVQTTAAKDCKEMHKGIDKGNVNPYNCSSKHQIAKGCVNMQKDRFSSKKDDNKLTQLSSSKKLTSKPISRGVQNTVQNSGDDPDLQQVIDRWPGLSKKIKAAILKLIVCFLVLIISGCARDFWHPDNRVRVPIRFESKEVFDPNNPVHYRFVEVLYQQWQKNKANSRAAL